MLYTFWYSFDSHDSLNTGGIGNLTDFEPFLCRPQCKESYKGTEQWQWKWWTYFSAFPVSTTNRDFIAAQKIFLFFLIRGNKVAIIFQQVSELCPQQLTVVRKLKACYLIWWMLVSEREKIQSIWEISLILAMKAAQEVWNEESCLASNVRKNPFKIADF